MKLSRLAGRLLSALALSMLFAAGMFPARAQDRDRMTGVERSAPGELVHVGACVYEAALAVCPALSSPLDECDERAEITPRETRLLGRECRELSEVPELAGSEVRIDLIAVEASRRRFVYRVRMRAMRGDSEVRSSDRSGQPLTRVITSAADALMN